MKYPNIHFDQALRDVIRSIPEDDPFYDEEIILSIGRVMKAYVMRNHSIGYMQGMNNLLARLRKFLSEEETFWTFVIIVEVYLPPEHFQKVSGIQLNLQILQQIMKKYNIMDEVSKKLEDHG
jgi:hypothetical protein